MAYNAISQADHEVASNSGSDVTRSPSPAHDTNAFQPLPLDLVNLGGGSFLEPAKTAENSSIGTLSSMIRSMTSTSYDIVEEDDYHQDADPAGQPRSSLRHILRLDTTATTTTELPPHATTSPELPLRSPSSDDPVPLSHPTPDLQSLQGAYIGNVERLERSAERLSLSSADIGSEIRKMDLEQKRRSSVSNSIMTRNDEFSPTANVSSPRGSILSATRLRSAAGSRLAQVSEPEHEGDYSEAPPDTAPVAPMIPPPQSSHPQHSRDYHEQYLPMEDEIERPPSAASGDTYQQARTLFNDFDGVHFIPRDKMQDSARRVSLRRPPLARGSEAYKEPQAGENMVYYPAPVPMMLNLPPRLSQKPHSDREKRRTQLLGSVPAENRKSAAWLSDQEPEAVDGRHSKRYSNLPPQLRASVFFEQPAATLDVQVKEASAVATLDSILDASAHAPVTAFTDHPYAGHVGAEVYGASRNKPSSKNLADQRNKHRSQSTMGLCHSSVPDARDSSIISVNNSRQTESEAADVPEGSALRSSHDSRHDGADGEHASRNDHDGSEGSGEDGHADGDQSHKEGDSEDEEDELSFTGPPTTLLAELQLRKKELQQRRRTAGMGEGLHSTLLELDAVAQKQSEQRRQRPVTLAWESPDLKQLDGDDEDVPLAMLYPGKANLADDSRPLGLMERRQLEESEPLSQRRARLRGEAPPASDRSPSKRPSTMYSMEVPTLGEPESGDEGETLAQRLKRLRNKDRTSTVGGSDFASEVMAEFNKTGHGVKEGEDAAEEETLAQRRSRLQRDPKMQQTTSPKTPKTRRSMADLLQAHPVPLGRKQSHDFVSPRGPMDQQYMQANRASMYQLPTNFPYMAGAAPSYPGYAMANPHGYGMGYPNALSYSNPMLAMNNFGYAMPGMPPAQHSIDSGQRDMIDRWRQSIR